MTKKILIIEDEKSLVEAIQTKLEAAGYEIEKAFDGEQGIAKLGEGKIDLILLDILMPVMDGISFLKKIKTEEAYKNIPVIILTNLSDSEKVAQVLELGETSYLIKSDSSLDSLIEMIKKKLREIDS
jgi:DNA-binding response OmpR family regulator